MLAYRTQRWWRDTSRDFSLRKRSRGPLTNLQHRTNRPRRGWEAPFVLVFGVEWRDAAATPHGWRATRKEFVRQLSRRWNLPVSSWLEEQPLVPLPVIPNRAEHEAEMVKKHEVHLQYVRNELLALEQEGPGKRYLVISDSELACELATCRAATKGGPLQARIREVWDQLEVVMRSGDALKH